MASDELGAHVSQDGSNGTVVREQVEACVQFVVECVNDKQDHLPAVGSSKTVSFPFDTWIENDGRLSLGFGLMKKVLMQTCPPPMLS